MEVGMFELTPEMHRERIMRSIMKSADLSLEEAEKLDEIICEAVGIDTNESPPFFLLSAQE